MQEHKLKKIDEEKFNVAKIMARRLNGIIYIDDCLDIKSEYNLDLCGFQ